MTREEVIEVIKAYRDKLTNSASNQLDGDIEAFDMAIDALKFDIDQYCKEHFVVMVDEDVWEKAEKALEQEPIDKSAMMCELYMEGVNMGGEYQGCWVRFKDIERVVDKYIGDKE